MPGCVSRLKQWWLPNASNREAWVRSKLKGLNSGGKILDAGAGQQPYKQYCGHLRYFAQDFGEYRPAGEGLQIQNWDYGRLDYQGDIWDIREQDGFFDAILCTEVLEHIAYPNETLREFSRLLKPGGTLLLTAPYACLPHMRPYFFYSGFSPEYYRTVLEKNHFTVQEIQANGNYFLYLVQEMIRSVRLIRNWPVKILYALTSVLPLLLLRLESGGGQDEQLVFGYHVVAVKK